MVQILQNGLSRLSDLVAWAPNTLVGAIALAIIAAIAVSIHGTLVRLLRRVVGERHPHIRYFLDRTTWLTLLGLLVLALFIALPATPFDADTRAAIAQILALASVILIGWTAITIVNMTADLYLVRSQSDVGDNLQARKHLTQVRVLTGTINTLLIIATVGGALMTFEPVRQYGLSLFASAGVAGLIAGLAARPVLSNLFAGIQIAMTQPIRIGDGVLVENEFGQVEEITSAYVVIRLWDLRRLIVPLTYFIEKPFQNWTRESGSLLGTVLLYVDYTTPVDRVRATAEEIVKSSRLWDGKVLGVQVTDMKESTIELRVLVSGRSPADTFNLRCEMREKLIEFLQRAIPAALPRRRQEVVATGNPPAESAALDPDRIPTPPA